MDRIDRLEKAVIDLARIISWQQCPCSPRERENGHRLGCEKPGIEEAMQEIIASLKPQSAISK